MSDTAVTQLGGGVVSLVGLWVSYKIHVLGKDVRIVRHEVNSMKDELVNVTGMEAFAAGKIVGGAAERRDQGRPPLPREDPIPPPKNGPQL
jgi:hypothetical protein